MAATLLERPAPLVPAPARRPRGAGLVVGIVVAALALLGANRAMDLLPSFGNPIEQATVDRTGPALLTALSDLQEYHAARATLEVVVDLEKDTAWVPSLISGERTTYLAKGTVDALVDFRGLGSTAVAVAPDRSSVTITLPAPVLGRTALDTEGSRVVGRDRGLVDRVTGAFEDSPTSEREVQALAQTKLERAAAESDVLARAEQSTRATLVGMAQAFGVPIAYVVFTPRPAV